MKKNENTTIEIIAKKHLYHHKAALKIGDWKKHFDFNYVNTIIAMALNHSVKNNELVINGYLITRQHLFLIAKTSEKKIDTTVHKIEVDINYLLKTYPQKPEQSRYKTSFIFDDENVFYAARLPLFKIHPLKIDYLEPLLTGKKVTLPYYNPALEAIKSMIKNHSFCSAIDYSGAIGPVDVTLLKD